MGYFKTTVRAGATIEVTKSYTKRIGVKIKGREKTHQPRKWKRLIK